MRADDEDERFERLQEITNFFEDEAERCKEAKAFFAGTIMLGAELEGLLLIMMECYTDEIKGCILPPGVMKNLANWKTRSRLTLDHLLEIAKQMKWLPFGLSPSDEFHQKGAKIGDYAKIVQGVRNFVHPGRWIREQPEMEIEEENYEAYFEILQVVKDWLRAKLEESIMKAALEHEHKTQT